MMFYHMIFMILQLINSSEIRKIHIMFKKIYNIFINDLNIICTNLLQFLIIMVLLLKIDFN